MSYGSNQQRQYLRPHRGTTILVLGLLGMLMCQPLGLFAWSMGGSDLRLMRAGQMDRSGEGMTNAGYILGIISSIIFLIQIAFFLFFILLIFIGAAAGAANA